MSSFCSICFKVCQCCVGLSGHAGKRACLWCEGLRNKERGKLKTLTTVVLGLGASFLK